MVDFKARMKTQQSLTAMGLQLNSTGAPKPLEDPWKGPPLAEEQLRAVGMAMGTAAPVVVLTGAAGTGKSTVIRYLKEIHGVAVCATTGKAAMNIGGCTIDAMFSLNRDKWCIRNPRWLEVIMKRTPRHILIEEASMTGRDMANLVFKMAQSYLKTLILVGDWGQAKPVLDSWPFGTEMFTNPERIKLLECHRQSQGEYLDALNRVRLGRTTEEDADLFRSRGQPFPPDKHFDGLCIFGTKARVAAYNEQCLAEHTRETGGTAYRFLANFEDKRAQFRKDKHQFSEADIAKFIDSSPMAHMEFFADGCKVVFTANDPVANGARFVNGDIGVLLALDPVAKTAHIEVHRPTGNHEVILAETARELLGPLGDAEYSVRGYPIALGYGVTCHRAQGMTVDRAWVDIDSFTHFPEGGRHGLGYVALSRTRTLEGLKISGWNDEAFEVDEIARPWL